jgi:GntR family transcriptional regulator
MPAALPLPKYHQVYLVLRQQLAERRFGAGLPGEMALVKQFGVARVTVRKALERLAAEGLIERTPGRGTRALPTRAPAGPAAEPAQRARLSGLLENIVSMGLATKVRVLSCETIAAPDLVAAALALPEAAPVQKAVRLRATREGPLSYITTYVPSDLARGIGRRELARRPLLLLLEAAGVQIGRATQTLSATLADAEVARHLAIDIGSPLLAVTRLVRDAADRPVQWLHGLYRPDRYQYEMQLSRVGGIDAKLWVSDELSAQFH